MMLSLYGLYSSALSLRYCWTPRSICWPSSAPMPVNGATRPILTSCAWASAADMASTADAARTRLIIEIPPRVNEPAHLKRAWFSGRSVGRKGAQSQACGAQRARRFSAFCDPTPAVGAAAANHSAAAGADLELLARVLDVFDLAKRLLV